ncbi:P-loop containing nucleoside triphosphate hydrolase protein [Sistotremastrum suecicum HHB10207 ss-3]|uniref:DNA 3'-5' helicase n=1 Tax=Sistotremastrum suecicum HHB10207 ss-3 TaxID=1314776 RepID=A0A166IB62_9AGAM|nr:P-loop containing nucleoside triphosphate hydrolase protein [Sistotremastrum suecicum HHB10207 ss-3]
MPPRRPPVTPVQFTSPSRRHKTPGGQSAKRPTKSWHENDWKSIADHLKKKLKLTFAPEEWQARTILSILARKDVMFVAGTGYGKSLVFEGLAVLDAKKTVVVICPLKALENDQVASAEAKGLRAVALNESTQDKESAWKKVEQGKFQLVYISPEMALSNRFRALCTRPHFRNAMSALIIDEAHCIEQWGDEFRKSYKELSRLRCYTGTSVPFVACSATVTTASFQTIWNSLDFGRRRFWGTDVGCRRPELTYVIQKLTNEKDPALDLLDLVPALKLLNKDSKREDIPKILFYLPTQEATTQAVLTFRALLPEHLRDAIHSFNSLLSEDAKANAWVEFSNGRIRILCSTDAAGMGCNASDVEVVVVVGQLLKSLSVLVQRWGRAARGAGKSGTCWLLVPGWAFEPEVRMPALDRVLNEEQGRNAKMSAEEKEESKAGMNRRAKLQLPLLNLINTRGEHVFIEQKFTDAPPECIHSYLSSILRPKTDLDVYEEFNSGLESRKAVGTRSIEMTMESCWVVRDIRVAIDLAMEDAPQQKCCSVCYPSLRVHVEKKNSPRKYFLLPADLGIAEDLEDDEEAPGDVMEGRERGYSMSSTGSNGFTSQASCRRLSETRVGVDPESIIIPPGHVITEESLEDLKQRLLQWRRRKCIEVDSWLCSEDYILPDSTLTRLVKFGPTMVESPPLCPDGLARQVKWDLGTQVEVQEVYDIFMMWRHSAQVAPASPRKGRKRKQARVAVLAPHETLVVFDTAPYVEEAGDLSQQTLVGDEPIDDPNFFAKSSTPSSSTPTHEPAVEFRISSILPPQTPHTLQQDDVTCVSTAFDTPLTNYGSHPTATPSIQRHPLANVTNANVESPAHLGAPEPITPIVKKRRRQTKPRPQGGFVMDPRSGC